MGKNCKVGKIIKFFAFGYRLFEDMQKYRGGEIGKRK